MQRYKYFHKKASICISFTSTYYLLPFKKMVTKNTMPFVFSTFYTIFAVECKTSNSTCA